MKKALYLIIFIAVLFSAGSHSSAQAPSSPPQIATGYKLPFAGGWGANMTQGPMTPVDYSHNGLYAWDFLLWQGQTSASVGDQGYVTAAKDGIVIYAKDCSYTSSTQFSGWEYANLVIIKHSETEYSWYYHLEHDSIPDAIRDAQLDKTVVASGTVIGREGATGYSIGSKGPVIHLHFMVSKSIPNLGAEDACDHAPWPTDTLDVDFDDWDEITTSPVSENYIDPGSGVVLYRDAQFKGPSVKYNYSALDITKLDSVDIQLPDFMNHQASSMRVTPSYFYTVELFSDTFFEDNRVISCGQLGTDEDFTDNYCVSQGSLDTSRPLNDTISSIRIVSKLPIVSINNWWKQVRVIFQDLTKSSTEPGNSSKGRVKVPYDPEEIVKNVSDRLLDRLIEVILGYISSLFGGTSSW